MVFLRFIILFLLLSYNGLAQQKQTHTIYFNTDEFKITPPQSVKLDSFIYKLKTQKFKGLTIYGYCDDRGSIAYNNVLSQNRANAVKSYLKSKHIPDSLISFANGKGEIALNNNQNNIAHTRQQNRRVDIKIVNDKKDITFFGKSYFEGDKIVLEKLYFKLGYTTLNKESIPYLKQLTDSLLLKNNIHFTVQGHVCCTTGSSDAINRKTKKRSLSYDRAKFIYNYFIRKGIDKQRMKFEGLKRRFPLGKHPKYDRRVEILITEIE